MSSFDVDLSDSWLLTDAIGAKDVAKLAALLESGVSPNVGIPREVHPLGAASESGCIEIVLLLLDHGADPDFGDPYGDTALVYAVIGRNVDIAELLLERGANVNHRNQGGETALCRARDYAVDNPGGGYEEVVDFLVSRGAIE